MQFKHQQIANLVVYFLQTQPKECGTLEDISKGVIQLDPNIATNVQDFDASLRDCIQKYSSDSKKFKYADLFYAVEGIGKGVWGLRQNLLSTLPNLAQQLDKEIEIIKETGAIREVAVRLVQPEFRKKLIDKYKSTCPLTGITADLLPSFLRASHIKPWSKSNNQERLDVNNGILLSVHLDSLFDRGMISFDNDGNLLYKNEDVKNLIETNFSIKNKKIDTNLDMQKYLEWHRKYYGFDTN